MLRMKVLRVLSTIAALLLGAIAPACATSILTTGAGGVFIGSGPLSPPAITPQLSAQFDMNPANGSSNNALILPTNSTYWPSTVTNSAFWTFSGRTDSYMETASNYEYLLSNGNNSPLYLIGYVAGKPQFLSQAVYDGTSFGWWWGTPGVNVSASGPTAPTLTNYNTGLYPWTATGGNCQREPSGYYGPSVGIGIVDLGFNCAMQPVIVPAAIPGFGSQQTVATGATSCVSNSPVFGEMTVTTTVAVKHGVYPNGQFTLSGFSGAGNTGYNATYRATTGTTGTTLVGIASGSCPANSPDTSGGLANPGTSSSGGTGAYVTMPSAAIFKSNWTGVSIKQNQEFCGVEGEYGADSLLPGLQYLRIIDAKTGLDLYGSPATPYTLNQGASNFTGYVFGLGAVGSAPQQDTSFPITASISAAGVMNVTAVTFTATASISGTTMTVTGTPTGILATGLSFTGAGVTAGTSITALGTGTGGAGTYTVNNSQTISSETMTVSGVLATGMTITGPSLPPTTIASFGSGSGGTGTYNLAATQAGALPSGTYTAHTYNPALVVTALNSYTITAASYSSSGNGQATFTTSAVHGLIPGSIFTVSGVTPSGYNGVYIALAGTANSTLVGTTITSPAVPTLVALANPGTYSSGGTAQPNIVPGLLIAGTTGPNSSIMPFGALGSTGTGGTGTYAININQPTWTFTGGTGGVASTSLVVTAQPGGSGTNYEWLAAGVGLTGSGVSAGTYIATSVTGGSTGTYILNQNATVTAGTTLTTTGSIWTSGAPGNLYALASGFYYHPQPSTAVAYGGAPTAHTQASLGNFIATLGAKTSGAGTNNQQWGGSVANFGTHWGVFPQDSTGAPSLTALQAICNKTQDYLAFDTVNSITAQALYRMDDAGTWGDSSDATITGYISGASGTSGGTATLNVSTTVFGSLVGSGTNYLAGPGLAGGGGNYATLTLTGTAGSSYTITFPAGVTSANLGSSGSPVRFSVGKQKPMTLTGNGYINGYLTTSGGSGPCATQACLHVTSFQTSTMSWNGSAHFTGTLGSGGTLVVDATTAGTPAVNQLCLDSTNITGAPIGITSYSAPNATTAGSYYSSFASSGSPDTNVVCAASWVTPNQVLSGTSLPYPVMITGYANGSIGGLGDYLLSNASNGAVGSSGSPVAITLSGIFAGPAVSYGPALTINDHGPGTTFAIPPGSSTGNIVLTGAYNTTSLGGTPSAIQAQLSATPNGPAVSGFSWANLSPQSINSGNWSGTISNVPAGQYWVSVRPANGTAYVQLPNFIKVGAVLGITGEGTIGTCTGATAGQNGTSNYGFLGGDFWLWAASPIFGPPIVADAKPSAIQSGYVNRFQGGGQYSILPECQLAIAQSFWNLTGVPISEANLVRNGVGVFLPLLGNQPQTQTLGVGDGTSTEWCSSSTYCANSANGPLTYNAANLYGASITGSVATSGGVSTLTVTALTGVLSPGLVLSGANVTGSPTLVNCASQCNFNSTTGGTAVNSTWTLSSNQGTISSQTFTVKPAGGAPLQPFQNTTGVGPVFSSSNYAMQAIKPGTFSVSVGGTKVCDDSAFTFDYTKFGGTCAGAGIASSFVNYQTGAYQVTFSTPPANGAAINATWTNLMSDDQTGVSPNYYPELVDWFGFPNDSASGLWAATFDKFPSGASAIIHGGCDGDWTGTSTVIGYPLWAINYSQVVAYIYGTKLPAMIPAASPPALITATYWRVLGAATFGTSNSTGISVCQQWAHDVSASSHFTGYITSGATPTLTLTATTTDEMWEGEVIGCNPYSISCGITPGTQIVALTSGSWGTSGSVYSLTAPVPQSTTRSTANVVAYGSSGSPKAMLNEVYYGDVPASGGAPGYFGGSWADVAVYATDVGTGLTSHPTSGFNSGRRIGSRIGSLAGGWLSGGRTQTLAAPPTVSRSTIGACDGSATASPCFDIGSTYGASATATWSGATVTITGGLSAHARPFVNGMSISCSGCNTGLVITSLSVPPTQSTTSGQGQVGNTFTFTASGTIGGSGSGTISGGCSGTSGTGSNCIDINFAINTGGTYGTTASLATCGVNNITGASAQYAVSSGRCIDSGIGSLVRNLRIGTNAWMGAADGSLVSTGDLYDDGADPVALNWIQTGAFTCNIVAPTVVQCVKAPARSLGVVTGVGQWLTGSTYISYGNGAWGTAREGSIVGYPGGQTFSITNAGSGYTNNTTVPWVGTATSGTCTAVNGGGYPKLDVWVSGGAIVDAYPSSTTVTWANYPVGIRATTTCTYPTISNTNYPGIGAGSSGTLAGLTVGPSEGLAGVATYNSDNNMTGTFLYDNSGEPGNPLNAEFMCGPATQYCEPGLQVVPFGIYFGLQVSG